MKIFLETYGCQMNEYDSELVRSILQSHNYEFTEDATQAKIILLNTCAVRENAQQKIYQRLCDFKKLKKEKKILVVGVLGCMSQSMREKIQEQCPLVDVLAGPDTYKNLPSLLKSALEKNQDNFDFSLSKWETYSDILPNRVSQVNAWIAIMRGCDNFCTFCVVPYTRGRERSRTLQSILEEANNIAKQGYKQITLLGQNVNSYKSDNIDFADLVKEVARIEKIERIRFTSPHPKDFSKKLLHIMAENPKICKHIHLPLQAGSSLVLERMNRNYTQEEYLNLAQEIRSILPSVSFTTDIICGFCGETEEDFQQTLNVMTQVEFDSAFIFKYSQRKNTIACKKYKDDVPEETKTERVKKANELQRKISLRRNQAEIGKTFSVLVEHPSKKKPQEWFGRTDHNKGVVFTSSGKSPGDLVEVKIVDAGTNTLLGF